MNLDVLGNRLRAALDPTGHEPPALRRVCDTIVGLEGCSAAPPEICPGLDYPTWLLLRQHAKEWLLPGVGELPKDAVVAMESNPAFVDAFLTGLNTQLLSELRWRGL